MSDRVMFGVGIFLLVAFLAALAISDEMEWRAFSKAHNCVKVGEMSGSTSTGFGFTANGQSGVVTTYVAGKTGYACDDGVTYWR